MGVFFTTSYYSPLARQICAWKYDTCMYLQFMSYILLKTFLLGYQPFQNTLFCTIQAIERSKIYKYNAATQKMAAPGWGKGTRKEDLQRERPRQT